MKIEDLQYNKYDNSKFLIPKEGDTIAYANLKQVSMANSPKGVGYHYKGIVCAISGGGAMLRYSILNPVDSSIVARWHDDIEQVPARMVLTEKYCVKFAI